ncbi:hypothetical protein [Sphingomonas sp.]|uniref:hypothetical protein n=1 Tax=Sphingomonas sp. TaxID=28214 RepID=UPI001D5B1928|nr:hypothetical protein [Sphingomonas sp.]MBX9796784.1 hypothetical protein [Sphingomonas sp.]
MQKSPAGKSRTGFRPSYRVDEVNRCLGCGKSHWYVGRISAECAFCGVALPISGQAAHVH